MHDGLQKVWWQPCQHYSNFCISDALCWDGDIAMVWVSHGDIGHVLLSSMEISWHVATLETTLVPFLQYLDDVPIFQQDNARPTSASITTEFSNQNNVNVLPWPTLNDISWSIKLKLNIDHRVLIHSFFHYILPHAITDNASITGGTVITDEHRRSVRSFTCTGWCYLLHKSIPFYTLPENGHLSQTSYLPKLLCTERFLNIFREILCDKKLGHSNKDYVITSIYSIDHTF